MKNDKKFEKVINFIIISLKNDMNAYELEDKVIALINQDESILTVQDNFGMNLGMRAARFGLEKVVMRCLEKSEASVQQDQMGWNIGMHAAMNKLEQATIKALDNYEAALQQDNNTENIGMHAAMNRLEQAVIKALENHDAANQTDYDGRTIADIAKEKGLVKEDDEEQAEIA